MIIARTVAQVGRAALALAALALLPASMAAQAQDRPRSSVEREPRPMQRIPRVPRPPVGEDDRPPAHLTRPLPEIVANVQATPPYSAMDYIGVAGFETRRMVYVLRFLDGRQVVVVHVDARSGRVLRRAP